MSFPDKEARSKCWLARDDYWVCLDGVDKGSKKLDDCKDLRKLYEAGCPSQWVKHFDRKREYEKFKRRLETDGYDPLEKK